MRKRRAVEDILVDNGLVIWQQPHSHKLMYKEGT